MRLYARWADHGLHRHDLGLSENDRPDLGPFVLDFDDLGPMDLELHDLGRFGLDSDDPWLFGLDRPDQEPLGLDMADPGPLGLDTAGPGPSDLDHDDIGLPGWFGSECQAAGMIGPTGPGLLQNYWLSVEPQSARLLPLLQGLTGCQLEHKMYTDMNYQR